VLERQGASRVWISALECWKLHEELPVLEALPSNGSKVMQLLPYDDGFFDLVMCQQGLQFFLNRMESAREIFRVLKPGGKRVACVWQGTDVHPIFGSLFGLVAEKLDAPFLTR